MKIKNFVQNLTLSNAYHFVVGTYKTFIQRQYSKHFNDTHIEDVKFKVSQCPECYLNEECTECGCSATEMFNSNKPCPKGKF